MVRPINKKRYLVALFITGVIFTLGLLLGAVITESKFTELKDLQQDLRTQLASYDIQSLLVEENICKFNNVDDLIQELGLLADRLTAMEEQLGKYDSNVVKLKEYYSLLEIRHWLILKKLNQECGTDYDLILFFYSGDEKECPSCESQGYILSYLRAKYPTVRVYSFDINIRNPALDSLKDIYSVNIAPVVVINDIAHTTYLTREDLERILTEKRDVTYLPK